MRNDSSRMDFYCPLSSSLEWLRRATMSGISAKKKNTIEFISLPSNITPLDFYFWASQRDASAPVLPRLQRVEKH